MKRIVICLMFCVFLFSGCSTIMGNQMSYLGDDNPERNVIGVARHSDWLGIGISADQYAEEYEEAAKNALRRGPSGTVALQNIKVFKEYKFTNQILGTLLYSLGSAMIMVEDSEMALLGLGLGVTGFILTGINRYDLVLIADPVIK